MRIKVNKTTIFEVKEVSATPGGMPDPNNKGKYTQMICSLTIVLGDGECDHFHGEFNCKGATTMEECEEAAVPFMDELYKNGCIDISTEEQRAKYGLTLY